VKGEYGRYVHAQTTNGQTYNFNIQKESRNTTVIESGKLTITVTNLSATDTKVTYSQYGEQNTTYEVITANGEEEIIFNGQVALALPVTNENSSTLPSSSEPTDSTDVSTVLQKPGTINPLDDTSGATLYWWDNVYFIEGPYEKYTHPYRNYYDVSPYSNWGIDGNTLCHEQIASGVSQTLVTMGPTAFGAAIGGAIGAIAGPIGAAVGAAAGAIVGTLMQGEISSNLLDEYNCIWWWINIGFINWLVANSVELAILLVLFPTVALADILSNLGYLRMGDWTARDTIGMGDPAPPASGGGGGCPYLCVYNGSQYANEGLLNIHANCDVIQRHVLTDNLAVVNGMYLIRLTEYWETISYINEVELYATLSNGKTVLIPLVSAVETQVGNVLPQVRFDDDLSAVELGAKWNNGTSQSIYLQFSALPSIQQSIVSFTFVIIGHNSIVKN
jgi:hypothetical protein